MAKGDTRMRCLHCDGKGNRDPKAFGNEICPYCDGTGSIIQTNEEWRKNCSDEEFIKWIVGVCNLAVLESTYDVAQLRKRKYWEIWLKEKHKA